MVTVTLSETDTVMLFELASVRVQQDSAESRLVRAIRAPNSPCFTRSSFLQPVAGGRV